MGAEQPRGGGAGRTITTLLLVAILIVVLVVGFIIIDTANRLSRPFGNVGESLATQVQQVINPTPTIIADPVTVVRQVQALSRLETAAFTIEKVITATTGEGPFGFLFEDRLLLVAQGQVIAGVDLARMSDEDVQVTGSAVFVTMPASEIFVATLDNEATYIYDRDTGLLAGQNVDLETLARREAERQILRAALDDGILRMAQDNANSVIEQLLRAVGFEEVVFVTGTPGPDQNRGTPVP